MDFQPTITWLRLRMMRLALAGLASFSFPGPPAWSADGEWFRHPFGELRAYYGDWLAVCPNEGRDRCRIVQIVLEPGESRVGPRRMALNSDGDAGYTIDVYQRGMSPAELDPLAIDFDGQTTKIRPDQFRSGEAAFANVAETLTITDPNLAADIVRRMKEKNRMTVKYPGGDIVFSLRGVTAALEAIEMHQRGRDE